MFNANMYGSLFSKNTFSVGDKVKIKNMSEITGEVTKVTNSTSLNSNEYIYTVAFDNKNLIPPEMEYKENRLEFRNGFNGVTHIHSKTTHCPTCQVPWAISSSPVLDQEWRDCLKCNKRFEDF